MLTCKNIAEHNALQHSVPIEEIDQFHNTFMSEIQLDHNVSFGQMQIKVTNPTTRDLLTALQKQLKIYYSESKIFIKIIAFPLFDESGNYSFKLIGSDLPINAHQRGLKISIFTQEAIQVSCIYHL